MWGSPAARAPAPPARSWSIAQCVPSAQRVTQHHVVSDGEALPPTSCDRACCSFLVLCPGHLLSPRALNPGRTEMGCQDFFLMQVFQPSGFGTPRGPIAMATLRSRVQGNLPLPPPSGSRRVPWSPCLLLDTCHPSLGDALGFSIVLPSLDLLANPPSPPTEITSAPRRPHPSASSPGHVGQGGTPHSRRRAARPPLGTESGHPGKATRSRHSST